MICPECNGRGETIYYVETDRDENTVTVKQRKGICRTCNGSGQKSQTNADRIRSMTDEELSEFINALTVCDCCSYDGICSEYNNIPKCRKGVLEWLQQPTEGETK